MALKLKRKGISRVFPLVGGVEAWMEEGFAVDDVEIDKDNG